VKKGESFWRLRRFEAEHAVRKLLHPIGCLLRKILSAPRVEVFWNCSIIGRGVERLGVAPEEAP
jgi:hypothetical protein